jgi:cell division transport system ATP-binding protein
VIEFEEAGFSFGSTPVLRDVTLTIAPGSFHFLVGGSGSGKTTLLRLCHADLAPTSGRLRFFGQAIRPRDRNAIAAFRQTVGVLHQDCRFLDHLSLEENIALPLRVSGAAPDARRDDLAALLEWVDLGGRGGLRPRELSEAERKRAALARAVILSPEVILADEPTGNADWTMALQLLTLLIELNRMGKAVLVATHDMNLVQAAEDRVEAQVLALDGGRVRQVEAAH